MATPPTSGSTDFYLPVDEIIEAACDKVGGEWQTAVETSKARRSLNLVLIQLANKNISLNKLEIVPLTLVAGTQEYTLDNSYQDILNVTVSVPNTTPIAYLPIQRYGIQEFNEIPIQGQENRPNTFTTQRLNNTLVIKFWPIPDNVGTYLVRMVAAKKIQDVNASYQQVDLNPRYLPLLIQWLAYELANTRQGVDESVKARLKSDLQEIMSDTFSEDEERTDTFIKPKIPSGR